MSDLNETFPKSYTWPIRVTSFDADSRRRLKLSAILRYQQEAGELQLRSGGLPYERLYDDGIIFVTSRSRVRIKRWPLMAEELNLTTWHRENRGVQFYRSYQFADGSGQNVIEATTCFVIIDPVTHRLQRPKVFDRYGITIQPTRVPDVKDPEKIIVPTDLPHVDSRVIRYSDVDYNGHLNNTIYADLLGDYLPGGMEHQTISEFSINFTGEALEGEALDIHAGMAGDRAVVTGVGHKGPCFEAEALFVQDQ